MQTKARGHCQAAVPQARHRRTAVTVRRRGGENGPAPGLGACTLRGAGGSRLHPTSLQTVAARCRRAVGARRCRVPLRESDGAMRHAYHAGWACRYIVDATRGTLAAKLSARGWAPRTCSAPPHANRGVCRGVRLLTLGAYEVLPRFKYSRVKRVHGHVFQRSRSWCWLAVPFRRRCQSALGSLLGWNVFRNTVHP